MNRPKDFNLEEIIKEFADRREKELFEEAKRSKTIEDTVLILNPIHKKAIMESGLSKATILWSNLVDESMAFQVVDEEFKKNIKRMYGTKEGEKSDQKRT